MAITKSEQLKAKEIHDKAVSGNICELTRQEKQQLRKMSVERLKHAKVCEVENKKPLYTIITDDGSRITTTRPQRYGVTPQEGVYVYHIEINQKILRQWQRGTT